MEFTSYLDSLSKTELSDLDRGEFVKLIKYGSVNHIMIYVSTNEMSLVHCCIVISLRESIYPEFLEHSQIPILDVLETMPLLCPRTCGHIMTKYGLTDPVLETSKEYVDYISRLLSIDEVVSRIHEGHTVEIDDISDRVAKKFMDSRESLDLLIRSLDN